MEDNIHKIAGRRPKLTETSMIQMTKIKTQIKELNKELEKRIPQPEESKDKKSNG